MFDFGFFYLFSWSLKTELKSSVNQPTTSNENAKQVSSLRKRKADESDDSSSNTETKRVRISDDVQVQNVQEKKKKRRKKRQKPKIERDLPPLKVIPKSVHVQYSIYIYINFYVS